VFGEHKGERLQEIGSRFRWVGLLGIALLLLAIFILLEAFRGGPLGFENVAGKGRSYLPVLLTLGTFAGMSEEQLCPAYSRTLQNPR
jgi:hypothetical protein